MMEFYHFALDNGVWHFVGTVLITNAMCWPISMVAVALIRRK